MSSNFDSRLLVDGFKHFNASPDFGRFKVDSFEKTVKTEAGKKYLIHIHKYDQVAAENFRYEAKAQFLSKDGTEFDANLPTCKGKTVAEVEAFFEKVWKQLDCGYLK